MINVCYVLYRFSILSKDCLIVRFFVCYPHSLTTRDRITDRKRKQTVRMDSPALCLLLRPESRGWLEYLGWMLQSGGLSLKVSKPETSTGFVQEPEPEATKAPEAKRADQPILEPGTYMNLIDLWSADPVPTQVPTLNPLSSSPVPSGLLDAPVPSRDLLPMSLSDFLVPSPLLVSASSLDSLSPLVLSSSSALPPPQSPCGSSASPQAFPPPAWCCDESLAALRPSRPMSPPRPVGPPTPLQLCIPSSPPRPICPRTPLGSLVLPDKPRSVVPQPPPRTSGSQAVPRTSTPSASPGSSLPLVSLSCLLAPSSPRSAVSPAPPQSREPSTSPWASRPLMSPWFVDLSTPLDPPFIMVPPPWIDFWVSPSPSSKAPPWFLPPSTPPWCWSPTSLCPSPAPRPPSKPPPSVLFSVAYGLWREVTPSEGGANVTIMFGLVPVMSVISSN